MLHIDEALFVENYGVQLIRTSKMVHQIKTLVTKPDNLYFIPRTHTVEEKHCPRVVS